MATKNFVVLLLVLLLTACGSTHGAGDTGGGDEGTAGGEGAAEEVEPAVYQANPHAEQEQAAISAAEAWLAFMDGGEYASTYTEASALFKNAMTQEDWVARVQPLRESMGVIKERTLAGKQYATELPGAPAGEYVVLQFTTKFQEGVDRVEVVSTMRDEDGAFRVAGYFVQ